MLFLGSSDGKTSACNVEDLSLIPRSGKSLSLEDLLNKVLATHSNILTWKIPWTVEPGGLHSVGLQKEMDTTEQLTLYALSFHCSFSFVVGCGYHFLVGSSILLSIVVQQLVAI